MLGPLTSIFAATPVVAEIGSVDPGGVSAVVTAVIGAIGSLNVIAVAAGTPPVTTALSVTVVAVTDWAVVPLGILGPVTDMPALIPVVAANVSIDPVEALVSAVVVAVIGGIGWLNAMSELGGTSLVTDWLKATAVATLRTVVPAGMVALGGPVTVMPVLTAKPATEANVSVLPAVVLPVVVAVMGGFVLLNVMTVVAGTVTFPFNVTVIVTLWTVVPL